MKRVGSVFMIVVAMSAVGCASRVTPTPSPVPMESAQFVNQLVPARHEGCNMFGRALLGYLISGNNNGDPFLDQEYADDVGLPGPQARALVDAEIEACDERFDDIAPGVTKVLTQSYGAASVSKVSCPEDRVPHEGVTLVCAVDIQGTARTVSVTYTDNEGTYEVSRPN
ncbi:DUF4333 domain-containing protein [Rhodococcus sp. ACS1]|uniref:DUF4333 domain-containing protein n=1 Tax=Rhodococcus sp. ACS1 TaxID=2028570 RepID=UPI0015CA1D77|nr:DUF4333 domain-containing protein [Rhodococcus sp. ACS1]